MIYDSLIWPSLHNRSFSWHVTLSRFCFGYDSCIYQGLISCNWRPLTRRETGTMRGLYRWLSVVFAPRKPSKLGNSSQRNILCRSYRSLDIGMLFINVWKNLPVDSQAEYIPLAFPSSRTPGQFDLDLKAPFPRPCKHEPARDDKTMQEGNQYREGVTGCLQIHGRILRCQTYLNYFCGESWS